MVGFFLITFYYFCVCALKGTCAHICMFVCGHTAMAYVQRAEDNFMASILSFHLHMSDPWPAQQVHLPAEPPCQCFNNLTLYANAQWGKKPECIIRQDYALRSVKQYIWREKLIKIPAGYYGVLRLQMTFLSSYFPLLGPLQ